MTSQNNSDYGNGNDIAGTDYDWGVYNKQSNQNKIEDGGDHAWRILTKDEWDYVFKSRITTSGSRYAKAKVCDMNGVVLLPDNWNDGTYTLNNCNVSNAAYNSNVIDSIGWATLEGAGCVFLPAACGRIGSVVSGSLGYYWSSTCSTKERAYFLNFYSGALATSVFYWYNGLSVRLVYQVER